MDFNSQAPQFLSRDSNRTPLIFESFHHHRLDASKESQLECWQSMQEKLGVEIGSSPIGPIGPHGYTYLISTADYRGLHHVYDLVQQINANIQKSLERFINRELNPNGGTRPPFIKWVDLAQPDWNFFKDPIPLDLLVLHGIYEDGSAKFGVAAREWLNKFDQPPCLTTKFLVVYSQDVSRSPLLSLLNRPFDGIFQIGVGGAAAIPQKKIQESGNYQVKENYVPLFLQANTDTWSKRAPQKVKWVQSVQKQHTEKKFLSDKQKKILVEIIDHLKWEPAQ